MILKLEVFLKRGETRNRFASLLFLSLTLVTGCHSTRTPSKGSGDPIAAAVISKGKAVYQAHCIACHNSNPKLAGAVGPEVWGSSKELIQSRVLHGTYPDSYKPKRNTKLMVPLPQLESDIPSLHSYLNAP